MINIDQHIFEQVRRFEEGELSEAEQQEATREIETDRLYRQHQQYYHTLVKAISQAQEMGQLKIRHRKGISAEQADAFDAFIEKDRRAARRRVYFFRLLGVILLVLFSFLLGRRFNPSPTDTPEPPITVDSGPVAENSDNIIDEEPMGADGNAAIVSISYKKMALSDNIATLDKPDTRQIELSAQEGDELMVLFQNNTLQLFTPDIAQLKAATMVWITLEMEGQMRNFLKVGDAAYELSPSAEKVVLQTLQDEELLQWLK